MNYDDNIPYNFLRFNTNLFQNSRSVNFGTRYDTVKRIYIHYARPRTLVNKSSNFFYYESNL